MLDRSAILYKNKQGDIKMNEYVIETRNLTKQYGVQKSVSDLNIHVKRGRNLRLTREKWSRKNYHHENAFRFDKAYFWNSKNFWEIDDRK